MPITPDAIVFECDNCPAWTHVHNGADKYTRHVHLLTPPSWFVIAHGGNDRGETQTRTVACSERCLAALASDLFGAFVETSMDEIAGAVA